jgi:methyl-accepting chemotaxis protein
MFENLKLQQRIQLGFAAPIGLFVLTVAGVFISLNNVTRINRTAIASNSSLVAAQEIGYHVSNIQKVTRGNMLARVDGATTVFSEEIKASNTSLADLETLENTKNNSGQKQIVVKLKELLPKAQAYNANLFNLSTSGKTKEAIAIWTETKGTIGLEIDKNLEEYIKNETAILDDLRADRTRAQDFLFAQIVLGTLLAAGISAFLAVVISKAIADQVRSSASQVASSTTEIAATIEQQNRTINQQATSVNETTTTVEELGASSRQSAEQADASAAGAKEALAIAENGLRSVEQTTQGLNGLKESVRGIAEQIMRLSEQTGQISSVTAVVADIANQTNMLALNAAVEAARAGEQGKGFAVVASEIRKLADESKKSAERIYQLVSDVQAAMNSTVMVTDEGTKTANSSIQLAQGTADAFNSVAEAVNSVFLNNQQIALSSKQQAVAVQQVVSAMNAINLGSKETAAGIAQVKTATEQVNLASKEMLKMV